MASPQQEGGSSESRTWEEAEPTWGATEAAAQPSRMNMAQELLPGRVTPKARPTLLLPSPGCSEVSAISRFRKKSTAVQEW